MNIVVRTNLCSERLVQRRAKGSRHRFTGALAVLALAAFGFWWGARIGVDNLQRESAASISSEAALGGKLAVARAKEAQRIVEVAQRDAVLGFAKKRLNWAPVLERIFAATPANIEITVLHVKDAAMGESTVQITGRSTGAQPRLESDKCRLLLESALTGSGYSVVAEFIKLDDSAATIHVEQTDYPAAEFVIELKFTNAIHEERKT